MALSVQARLDITAALQCWGGDSDWHPSLVTALLLGSDVDSFHAPPPAAGQVSAFCKGEGLSADFRREGFLCMFGIPNLDRLVVADSHIYFWDPRDDYVR